MIINTIILFLAAAIPGLLLLSIPQISYRRMIYFLVFAGSYLFAITIIHLIPDLFLSEMDPFMIGLWILVGFFLQKILENFTSGVEHGHAHTHEKRTAASIFYLLVALGIHSFLEGSIMADSVHINHSPEAAYAHGSSPKILLGIVMHKIPAAIALMALLLAAFKSKKRAVVMLFVFALASPSGLLMAEYVSHQSFIEQGDLTVFFAIVAGGFLQISTTIFIESDPQHKLDWQRFAIAVLGASLAVMAQLFV